MALTHNNSQRSLIRNVLSGYLGTAVATLTGFFVTPLLLRYLGDRQFGLWSLLLTIGAYIGLVEMGLYASVSKRVAECLAINDRERLRTTLGAGLALYLVLAAAILVFGCLLIPFLGPLFHLPQDMVILAQKALLILCLSRALAFLFCPGSAVLFGAGRMDLLTLGGILAGTAGSVWNVVQAMHGGTVVGLSVTAAMFTLITGIYCYAMVRRNYPDIVISLRYASRDMARELTKFSSRNSLHAIFGNIAYNSDQIIIGLVMTTAAVANYAVAAKLTSMVSVLATKPITVLLPTYSHARAQNDKEREFRLYTQSVALSLIICMPFAVAGCLLGDRIIEAWVGAGHSAAYPVLIVLLLTTLLVQPGNASVMIMNATERNLFLVRAYAVAAPINLLVSWFLTKSPWFGLTGPAIGSMLTYLCVDATLLPIVVCRDFGFQYRAYLREGLGGAVAPLIAGCAVALGLRLRYHTVADNKLTTLLMLLVVVATCWGVWFLVALRPEQRRSYLAILETILKKNQNASPDIAA